jgi:hypothetical protein
MSRRRSTLQARVVGAVIGLRGSPAERLRPDPVDDPTGYERR